MRRGINVPITVLAVLLLVAATAAAQGSSGNHKPTTVNTPSMSGTSQGGKHAIVPALPVGQSIHQFASALDDADVLEPGAGNVAISVSRWEGIDGGETDAPSFDFSLGLAKRVQLNASVPFYHASYSGGYSSSGRGDMQVATKIGIISPDSHGFGLAISPTLEVLSDLAISDPTLALSRTNWALPISLQIGTGTTRGFGSVGYFSRGSVFTSLALDHAVNSRLTLVGAVLYSRSTRSLDTTALAGLNRYRVDATVGGSIAVAPHIGVYVSGGRTISAMDQNGARLILNAGLGIGFGGKKVEATAAPAEK